MMRPERRRSAVTVLVAIVMLLVPALAWLQYRWVGQVSEAERERMQRTLRASAWQFATAVDTELSRALAGLQVEGSTLRDGNWVSYAQRYSNWAERAADPRLVREVLLVDLDRPAGGEAARSPARRDTDDRDRRRLVSADDLRLRRWDAERRAFDEVPWAGDLAAMREPLARYLTAIREMRVDQAAGRARRDGLSPGLSDDFTLISPVMLFDFDNDRRGPPRIDVAGFTLVRLDADYVRGSLLPSLVRRYFHDDDGMVDYRIAITDRREPSRIIWESEPGAGEAMRARADVEATFMSPRPDQVFVMARSENGGRRGTDGPPPNGRVVISMQQDRRDMGDGRDGSSDRGRGPFEGRWRVVATHRAGSLEAAVASVRTRNLMLSSGILLLLTTAVGLIAVSARRAQALARQQMEFVAAVSHELRTPVSVIGTAASNLADGVVADPARVRKYGETIQGEARRLGETVERVLQLAGIAAGTAAAARGPVAVDALVQQSLAACRPDIEGKGVTVEVTVPDGLPPVHGDQAALRSALQNLITNAVKYGGDARWVGIEAAAAPAGPAAAGGRRRHPDAIIITVRDRGLGISPEDRARIFEPFYRGREAVSRQIQGSGLGLNLVARIVEAHGGRVDVTSAPGQGSAFSLRLPVAAGPAAGISAAVSSAGDASLAPRAQQITS